MVSTVLFPALSQFAEVKTTEKTPLIELVSTYPISVLRDVVTLAGAASVTTGGGEHRLQTTVNGADDITLDSAARGRYQPGYSAEVGMGIRVPVLPTGSQSSIWGYADASNGVYFGVDVTGVFIARLSNGVETKVYQTDWNADPLNGLGPSGLSLDLTRGNIFQIVFSWYGYGVIEFQVAKVDAQLRQRIITIHRLNVSGSSSIQNPNLPIRIKASNGGTGTAFNVYVGGRQFAVVGRYAPNERTTTVRRIALAGVGTTPVPLVTARRKAGFITVPLRVYGIDALVTGDALAEVYLNGALTGASYGTPESVDASETSIERDVTASAISGGNVIWSTLISASGSGTFRSGANGISGLSISIPVMQPVTLAFRALSGTITATGLMLVQEDW